MSISNLDVVKWFNEESYQDSGKLFVAGCALFGGISSLCLGGYYLFRMMCTFGANKGDEKGQGFFWGRWKVVAVDLPSLLSTLYREPLSPLALFWTLEISNDLFPWVGYILEEMLNYLRDENNSNADGEDGDRNDIESGEGNAQQMVSNLHAFAPALIRVQKEPSKFRFSTCKRSDRVFHIDKRMPAILRHERMSESEWLDFCRKIDFNLQPIAATKNTRSMKTCLILLAILGYVIYWLTFFGLNELTFKTRYVVVVIEFFVLGLWTCLKTCYSRDLAEEKEFLDDMTDACNAESDKFSDLMFLVRMDDDLPLVKSAKWICSRGLSCEQPMTSIRHIECRVTNASDSNNETWQGFFPISLNAEVVISLQDTVNLLLEDTSEACSNLLAVSLTSASDQNHEVATSIVDTGISKQKLAREIIDDLIIILHSSPGNP